MIVRARTEIDEPVLKKIVDGRWKDFCPLIPSAYFFNSGCAALRFFLQLYGKGKKVGIQVFTCSSVLDAIQEEDDEAVFLDIDSTYYTSTYEFVEPKIQLIDILVLTHLFGIPNPDYIAIKELCRRRGVVLIDDLCQTYHAKIGGVFLEDLSDNYFYSFFYDKPISSLNGGMLKLSCDSAFLSRADSKYCLIKKKSRIEGVGDLKVLLLMHRLLSPSIYNKEFRYGLGWKMVLRYWPLKWNVKYLNKIVNGKWFALFNRIVTYLYKNKMEIKRMSDVETEYIKCLMQSYTPNNRVLLDFLRRFDLGIPPYLSNKNIECSIAKRAIVRKRIRAKRAQFSLYNWPDLICSTQDYCKYPNAFEVITTCTNIPCWTDEIKDVEIDVV